MLLYRLIPLLLLGGTLFSEGALLRRVQAHLLLNDPQSAAYEAREALKFESSSENLIAAVTAFSAAGDEKAMMTCFEKLNKSYPSQASVAYAPMAWGILKKGASSKEPMTRVISLAVAAEADSAKSVQQLLNGMKDSSALVRSASVEFSKKMRDRVLQDEVVHLLQKDPSWHVRGACLKSLGTMQAHQAETLLEGICSNKYISAEERALAVMSLATLKQECSKKDLQRLVSSNREGLKLVALELLVNNDSAEDLSILKPLLKDRSKDVRVASLQVLGILGGASNLWHEALLNDPQPEVQLTAAWVALLNGEQRGSEILLRGIVHSDRDVRLYAAGLLKASGDRGCQTLIKGSQIAKDPLVKMNLSLGLIANDGHTKGACAQVAKTLKGGGRLMWRQSGIARVLCPSDHKYRPEVAQYPELMDQLTRLEVIQMLAIVDSEHAENALKDFLARRFTPVSGMAATVMFEEAEEEAEALVRKLLSDPNELIRTQAALLLALWGKEEEAVGHLIAFYPTSERNLKERILEALGRVGSKSAASFLVQRFSEPHEHLRILAASSLIQCLNH